MAERLRYLGGSEMLFPRGDYRWVDVRRFEVVEPAAAVEVLSSLVASPWYDHGYDVPRSDAADPGGRVHGPYKLDAIRASKFNPIDRDRVLTRLRMWADLHGPQPESFSSDLEAFVESVVPVGFDVWELPLLGTLARREWGDVVGVDGFHEFVAISPGRNLLNLVVAADD